MGSIVEIFRAGGIIMWPLLGTSCFIWFLMAWWSWSLWREGRAVSRLADEAVHTLRREGRQECMQRLAAQGSIVAQALLRFVASFETSHSRAQQDAALRHAEEELSAPDQYLQVLVRIAPLLGLLGTVYGMVETFGVLNVTGAREPRALAAGISTALLTTQAGLLIALPGLYGHEWLRRWEDRITMKLNRIRYTLTGVGE